MLESIKDYEQIEPLKSQINKNKDSILYMIGQRVQNIPTPNIPEYSGLRRDLKELAYLLSMRDDA